MIHIIAFLPFFFNYQEKKKELDCVYVDIFDEFWVS